jgi:serine/threonine protein kinase/Flp pilus assembly protein TadD
MEYVQGVTLREKIHGGKSPAAPIEMGDAISYAIQIGEALREAHGKGIVHRDIKSENIIVNEKNQVKVMDFGLAKLKGSLKLTRTSSTVGTLGYMSPEQIQGEDADGRSDIFSLGVVLFEMLTAHFPFRGEHEAAIVYSIVNSEPEPISKYRSEIPPEIERIVHRSLEKNPAQRYQDAGELVSDLLQFRKDPTGTLTHALKKGPRSRSWKIGALAALILALATVFYQLSQSPSGKSSAPPGESAGIADQVQQIRYKLAILPFQNIGGDEKMDFLGFALADNIITNLSYIRSIVVRPSSSITRYRKEIPGNEQLARELDVNVILAGSYVVENSDLHLNTQLVDVASNTIIWQKPIDLKYKSLLSVQKDITSEIIRGLSLRLSSDERAHVGGEVPHDPEAYELYLRATTAIGSSTDLNNLRSSITLFDQTLERERTFSPAYAGKGYAMLYLGMLSGDTTLYRPAEDALKTALTMDSTSPGVLSTLGFLYIQTGQKERAFPLLKRALHIAPNISDIHNNLAYFYRLCGLTQQSLEEASIALRLNPGDRRAHAYEQFVLFMMGRFDEALAIADEGLRRHPNDPQILILKGVTYYLRGDLEGMREVSERAASLDPLNVAARTHLGWYYAAKGERKKALDLIEPEKERAKADMEIALFFALSYGELGMAREATEMLTASLNRGLDSYPWIVQLKGFDKVRNDAGFQRLMGQMKMNYEHLRAAYGITAG